MKQYIYGKNTVLSYLKDNTSSEVFLLKGFKDQKILSFLEKNKIVFRYASESEFEKLVGDVNHQGIAAIRKDYSYYSLEELLNWSKDQDNPTIAILDGIEDPHNFGAILRSADALGIKWIIIGEHRQVLLNGTVSKVSTGAVDYVKVCKVTNLNQAIKSLKAHNYWIVASDGGGNIDYRDIDYKRNIAIVIGSEGRGISRLILQNSDYVAYIPMVGSVNSLNASNAATLFFAMAFNSKIGKIK